MTGAIYTHKQLVYRFALYVEDFIDRWKPLQPISLSV